MNFLNCMNLSKIYNFSQYWSDKGCKIIFIGSILIILGLGLYQILSGKSGKWSSSYFYDPYINTILNNKSTDKYTGNRFTNTEQPKKVSAGERECRRVLENIFRKPFPNKRPNFMNNEVTNFNLELDCFNEDLKLAVEYNGIQHYKYTKFFHANKDKFRNQQYRDYMKRDLCNKNNITLIEVPYTVKPKNIEKYLKNNLRKKGYMIL